MSLSNKKPKKHIAEESFRLSISDLGRGLLLPKENIENEKLYFLRQEAGELKGASGRTELSDSYGKMYLIFNVNLNRTPKCLILCYSTNPNDKTRTIIQKIELNESVVGLGMRPFFICDCGNLASVLYRPRGQGKFKCRICSNITYESCNINRQSLNGYYYAIHKMLKLTNKQECIKRMYYKGKPTKKAQSFMAEYKAWQGMVATQQDILVQTHNMVAKGL